MAAYISKEEKKIPINDPSGKWSDMTLLPEWEEEFYDVYTAKKHGKWVMLKALKKEYADKPEYQKMLEREFDTRYNLAHANIVMVNDYELIPDIGLAIITDDVYGYSLRRLIDENKVTPNILRRIETQLVDAIDYMQENHIIHHPITPDKIIFTDQTENLKLIDVGYDHKDLLTPQDTAEDILAYGKVLTEVLNNIPGRMQPGFQAAFAPVGFDGFPGLEHGLLQAVRRVLLVVGIVPAHPPEHLLVGRDQHLEGLGVAFLRAPQGEFVGHGCTSLSHRFSSIQTFQQGILFPPMGNFFYLL